MRIFINFATMFFRGGFVSLGPKATLALVGQEAFENLLKFL